MFISSGVVIKLVVLISSGVIIKFVDCFIFSGVVICAWGEDGAAAYTGSHDIVTSSVFSPERVIDTLGAGDTFNAATVLALNSGKSLKEAITYGCRVAGAKCGMRGYNGLKGMERFL